MNVNSIFQLSNLSRLSKLGIGGAVAVTAIAAVYGAYRYKTKANKEKADEADTPQASAPAEAGPDAATDRGDDSQVPGSVPEPQAQDQADLSAELQFFEDVYQNAKLIAPDVAWMKSTQVILKAKFNTSEPRKVSMGGVRSIIFPIERGVNIVLVGDEVHYLHADKRVHVKMNLEEQNHPMEVSPANQAKTYAYQKGMELIKVTQGVIHPAYAYPADFDADRGLAANFELKDKDLSKANEFFNALFDSAKKSVTNYPFTRSDMAYISTIINSDAELDPVRFANLEGDRFIHVADLSVGNRNMVLVQRAQGYVQLFRGDPEATSLKLTSCKGFEHWFQPKGELLDLGSLEHLQAAALFSPVVINKVMGRTEEPVSGSEAAAG